MPVSKRLRYEVLRRDNHTCRYCGASAPDVRLTVDHVVPATLGGSDGPENLVAACADCNSGKSASPADASLINDVEQDAIRWARAMTLAQDNAARQYQEDREYLQKVRRQFLEAWCRRMGDTWGIPGDFMDSLLQMVDSGLDSPGISEALDATERRVKAYPLRDVWAYFCGVGWRIARKRQEDARALIDSGAV